VLHLTARHQVEMLTKGAIDLSSTNIEVAISPCFEHLSQNQAEDPLIPAAQIFRAPSPSGVG